MRFRFIEDRRGDYPVRVMCDVLDVSPAGYYAWRSRPESQRSSANRDLVDEIKRVHRDVGGRYGSPDPEPQEVRATLSFSIVVHPDEIDKMRVDLEKFSAEFFGVNADVERSRNYHFTRRSFTSFAFFYNSFRRAPYQPAPIRMS